MKRPSGLLMTVLAAVVSMPLAAQDATKPPAGAKPFGQVSTIAEQAFRTWLDRTEVGRMLSRDASKVRLLKDADGGETLVFEEGFRTVLLARHAENGEAEATCVESVAEARKFFEVSRAPRVREP